MYYDTGGVMQNQNQMDSSGDLGDLNWDDVLGGSRSGGSGSSTSRQQSGLPAWFQPAQYQGVNDLWNAALAGGGNAWRNAQAGGVVNPNTQALIESQRTAMPEQYRNQMDSYYQRSINPMMNRLSSRGVLNSSVTGDALTKALREQTGKYGDQVTQANVWAGNELLKNMGTNQTMNMQTWQNVMQFLPQLLAAIRESSGESQSDWSNEGETWGGFPLE